MRPNGIASCSFASDSCGLYHKYKLLSQKIEKLEPNTIAMIYKEYKDPMTFFPNLGIYFNEFALFYSISAAIKHKETKH